MNAVFMSAGARVAFVFVFVVVASVQGSSRLAADDSSTSKEIPWRIGSIVDGAKILRKGSPFWQLVSRNGTVPAGSNLELPEGEVFSRSDIGAVAAQTLARFELPSANDAKQLHHIQGNVRYTIERRVYVTTPQLSLSTASAVFDVIADVHGTQIDTVSGKVSVITGDGVSEVKLQAGESARVSSTNLGKLQIRSAADPDFVTVAFGLGNESPSDDANGAGGERQSTSNAGRSESSDSGQSPDRNEGGNGAGNANNSRGGEAVSSGSGKGGGKGGGKGSGKGSGKGNDKGKGKGKK